MAASYTAAAAAFSYSTAFCTTSRASAVAVSFHRFLANYVKCSLTSSFFFCTADCSSSTMSGAHDFCGHASKTLKRASSVATNGSFVHCFVESFHDLMYILCISALKSSKLCRLLRTVGDKRDFQLVHIWMFISMKTQKILLSHILFASFMA